jgi:hypothetical protein
MPNNRDTIIDGTCTAERLIRDRGARGRDLEELVRDLVDRKVMPKEMLRRAAVANRIRNRIGNSSASLQPIEMHQWSETINRLVEWLENTSGREKSITNEFVLEKAHAPGADRRRSPWSFEPWMLMSILVLLAALVGAIRNHRAALMPPPLRIEQSANSAAHSDAAMRSSESASTLRGASSPRPDRRRHGSHVRAAREVAGAP